MLMVLSPSKTLDEISRLPPLDTTEPALLADANELVKVLRNYSAAKLSQLMDISDKLSALNVARYAEYSMPKNTTRPALFLFKGDVYEPMQVKRYGKKELAYAQQHLRILSGLYGVLRPLDMIQPYRLEMGTHLATKRGKDLYAYWGPRISEQLNVAMGEGGGGPLVNLASGEYFSSVKIDVLTAPVLHIAFKEKQKDKLKVIGLFAKKARGMMADFAIQNQINSPEKLKEFSGGGYCFQPKLSSPQEWVFTR